MVILRQVAQWLPCSPAIVLDASLPLADADGGTDYRICDVVMSGGHQVLTVARHVDNAVVNAVANAVDNAVAGGRRPHPVVVGDACNLDWIRSESVDAVIAEGGALSCCLAAEDALQHVARVLRPGGRFLASADSLVIGLARLAEQHRWPELADAPAADVVLVPDPEHADTYTRCFAPEDLRELLTGAGLDVEWIRPRTVIPATAVRQTLTDDPSALGDLVVSELSLADAPDGEGNGARLVVSGRKPLGGLRCLP